MRRTREERDLESWARENGAWIDDPADWLRVLEYGGEEHRVRDLYPHYLKATHPGRYGFTVVAGPVYPGLAQALPGEYLERLRLCNEHFGDTVRLEDVTREGGEMVVFTSQPTVVGTGADPEEVAAFMEMRWLRRLDGIRLGHQGAACFYRDLDNLAVFDAHPGNILKDRDGVILPIDLVAVTADEKLAEQLERAVADVD